MTGIRTIDDLKARCWVDEDTGCWHWRQGLTGGGFPSVWVPALGRRTTLGGLIGVLLTGGAPAPGAGWHCTCTTKNCANPQHRKQGDRSAQMLAAGIRRTPQQIARMAATKRASSKLPCEAAAAIRASDEPLRVLAERYGVSMSHASQIRRGEQRRPLPARGASVFNL